MDLGLLMSDLPERKTRINLFFTRINIPVSYNFVIFIAGRQHDGRIFDLERSVLHVSQPPAVGFT